MADPSNTQGRGVALVEVWVGFLSKAFLDIGSIYKNTHSTASEQLDVPGMIDRDIFKKTSRWALQPLKVQYPKQHYKTVLLRDTVQMLLQRSRRYKVIFTKVNKIPTFH